MPSFSTNDGVKLNYLDEGTGPVTILIAGYCAPATSWALTTDALVAKGHRVISFDRRSHGDSESPMFGQRMSRHGQDIAELLDSAELDDVAMVGGSMGGNSIWAYVDLFGTKRVRAISILDQTPKMVNTDDWQYGFYGCTPQNVGTLWADGVPSTGKGRSNVKSLPAIARLVRRLGGMPAVRKGNAPETIKLLLDHAEQDWRDVIARTDVPFLMIAARESQVWPCEHAEASVSGNPNGRALVIDKSGHAVNLDQVGKVNDALLELVGS
jgi:pimeloyl-ACP methyl ester carboxylesterase